MGEGKRKILIVDDEPNNLELMMRILGEDYELAFATSGLEALEATEKVAPDVILLDIMMPEMDGYETCRRLKKSGATKEIPVIFVTAKGDTKDEIKGLDMGAIDYVTKPISPAIVKSRVRNQLALKIAREEIEQKNRKLEDQNEALLEAAKLREDVERMSRHDLKTPLNAIISLPRIMMEDPNLPDNHMEFLQIMEKAGLRMLDMINLSLDLFKMERGIYTLAPAKMDILRIINQILNENSPLEEVKGMSHIIRINGRPLTHEESFTILGEDMLYYSMFANLIKNAFEASPENELISIEIIEENGNAVISIHNKGAVPLGIRSRFFDKYVTSGKDMGSGLGVYSAKLIAETHGGGIEMETSDDLGTTVAVRLPL